VNRRRRVEKNQKGVETGLGWLTRDEGRGEPADCSTGPRHEDGVKLVQASVGNVGTCRSDVKGEARADGLCEGESTNAEHRDGDARSRKEGSVMGLDRRGVVVQLHYAYNLQGDDGYG
jgi:hypothetical protein